MIILIIIKKTFAWCKFLSNLIYSTLTYLFFISELYQFVLEFEFKIGNLPVKSIFPIMAEATNTSNDESNLSMDQKGNKLKKIQI